MNESNKRLVLILFLTFCLSVATIHMRIAYSATINVPGDYATIQAAINAAASGDTIVVSSGLYLEEVVVSESVTLLGAKANADPRGGAWTGGVTTVNPGAGNWGFDVQASNVVINGFEVTGGEYGIYIGSTTVSNVEISYNDLHDNSKYGLQAIAIGIGLTVSFIDISTNYIHDNGRNGLKLVSVTDCTVSSNEFAQNGFGALATIPEYKFGVYVEDERYNSPAYHPCIRNTFTLNLFHDNSLGGLALEAMGNAVSAYWSSTTFLEQTVVENNCFKGDSTVWGVKVDNDYKDDGTQDGFGPIATIDAENNYWDSTSGPYHPTDNPTGSGTQVSDNVDFDPWLNQCPLLPTPVGGEWLPIDEIQLLIPSITSALLMALATTGFIFAKRRRHHT